MTSLVARTLTLAAVAVALELPLGVAAWERLQVPFCANPGGQVSLEADIYSELLERPLDYQGGGETDPALAALAGFYAAATAGDLSGIVASHSDLDGSRTEILASPDLTDRFAAYPEITSVTLGRRFLWNDFNLVNVTMNGARGPFVWRDEVLCANNECGLSTAFSRGRTSEIRLFEALSYRARQIDLDADDDYGDYTFLFMGASDPGFVLRVDRPRRLDPLNPLMMVINPEMPAVDGAGYPLGDPAVTTGNPIYDGALAVINAVRDAVPAEESTVVPRYWIDGALSGQIVTRFAPDDGVTFEANTAGFPVLIDTFKTWQALRFQGYIEDSGIYNVLFLPSTTGIGTPIDPGLTLQVLSLRLDGSTFKAVGSTRQSFCWAAVSEPLILGFLHSKIIFALGPSP